MIVGQDPTDDRCSHFPACLANDLTNPLAQCTMQDLEPVLRDPDNMIAMVENCVRGFIIGHSLSPRNESLYPPQRGLHFWETGYGFFRNA